MANGVQWYIFFLFKRKKLQHHKKNFTVTHNNSTMPKNYKFLKLKYFSTTKLLNYFIHVHVLPPMTAYGDLHYRLRLPMQSCHLKMTKKISKHSFIKILLYPKKLQVSDIKKILSYWTAKLPCTYTCTCTTTYGNLHYPLRLPTVTYTTAYVCLRKVVIFRVKWEGGLLSLHTEVTSRFLGVYLL